MVDSSVEQYDLLLPGKTKNIDFLIQYSALYIRKITVIFHNNADSARRVRHTGTLSGAGRPAPENCPC
jgi:hypothetical protein